MEPNALRTGAFPEPGPPGIQQSPPGEDAASSRVLDTEMRGSVMMELIVDKLKLLNYERQFCNSRSPPWPRLHKFYFALPSSNRNEQFLYFSTMVAWLFTLLGCHFPPPSEADDPNLTCSKIMMELMSLGFAAPSWPPARLKQGHGDAVCTVLDTLCSLVLDAIKFEFQPVTLHPDDSTLAALTSTVSHDDRSELYIPDTEETDATPRIAIASNDLAPNPNDTAPNPNLLATKWRLDLERIAPSLRIVVVADGNDWRAHLERAAKLYEETAARGVAGQAQLRRFEEGVTRSLEKLESHENFINQELEGLISEYVAVKGRLVGVQAKCDGIGEAMQKLAGEHAKVLEALDQVRYVRWSCGVV
jgi:estrogen-related receptor beta like 1